VSLVISATFFFISAYNDFPSSNQNHHALHASVLSGFSPTLSEDWFYKTTDPFPLATLITALFLKLGPGGMYFLYFVVIECFVLAWILFLASRGSRTNLPSSYLESGLIVLTALVLGRLTGLSSGVAYQTILSSMWQPSEAGVLLVLFALLFASGYVLSSAACAALAVALHPSIAFGAVILVASACVRLVAERQWKEVFTLTGAFTLLILPAVLSTIIQFMPTSKELAAEASHILAREKIPFHAIVTEWITKADITRVCMIIMAGSLLLNINQRLAYVMFISLIICCALTLTIAIIDDDRVSLLFPWRVSSVLAPIALVTIIYTLYTSLPLPWRRAICSYRLTKLALVTIVLSASGIQFTKWYYNYPAFRPSYWIKATFTGIVESKEVQDRLLRLEVINWATRRDSPKGVYLIPLDFEQFRIKSGRPIFVDWKTHPFKDVEVIEWKRRIDVAKRSFDYLSKCKQIESNEFDVVIIDNSSVKIDPSCETVRQIPINSRFGFIRLEGNAHRTQSE
jgi:hypothetical protein